VPVGGECAGWREGRSGEQAMWPSLVHGAQTKAPYIGLMVAPAVVLLLFALRVIAPLHSLAAPPLLLAECPCTSPLRLNPAPCPLHVMSPLCPSAGLPGAQVCRRSQHAAEGQPSGV
jgi:hypothetical protein